MDRAIDISKKASRRSIKVGKKLHTKQIQVGLALGYRRGKTGGWWTAKRHLDGWKYAYLALGLADDAAQADGTTILSFDQAAVKAREWWAKEEAQRTGQIIGGSYTIANCMTDYMAHCARERKIKPDDPKLGRVQATIDAFILPTLGMVQLANLTHGKVKAWRDALADKAPRVRTKAGKQQAYRTLDTNDPDAVRRRQATTNRVLSTLKAALNHAKAEKRITSDAAWVDIKPFKRVDVPKIRFCTAAEVAALVPACEPDFQQLVKGALLTGCRYGELTAMMVSEFSEQDARVYVARSKNGEARYVDLNAAGVLFFATLARDRMPTTALFLRANGLPWQQSEQKRPMDAACKAAGIEGVTFHILRHTFASHAVMAGMTIEVLAQQLGHKDTRITTRHYAHLCPTFKAEAVKRYAPSFGFDAISL
jgi:integrase